MVHEPSILAVSEEAVRIVVRMHPTKAHCAHAGT